MDPPIDLSAIKGGATKNAFAEGLRAVRENALLLIEYHQIDASIKRAKYLALVKEGFTEAQAIELCK